MIPSLLAEYDADTHVNSALHSLHKPKQNFSVSPGELLDRLSHWEQRYLQNAQGDKKSAESVDIGTLQKSSYGEMYTHDIPTDGGGDFCTVIPEILLHSARITLNYMITASDLTVMEKYADHEELYRSSRLLRFAELSLNAAAPPLNAGACVQLAFGLEVLEKFSRSEICKRSAREYLQRMGWEHLQDQI